MEPQARIEKALDEALGHATASPAPPGLADALRYAVFPGGGRIRPRLALSVAMACGDDAPDLATAGAAAIELLHCASLVHDDLPCFDDAAMRRGKPSVHRAYGERRAVLVGDSLIVLAFDTVARCVGESAGRAASVMRAVGEAVGSPHGIAAGQAWECEPEVALAQYHQAKTGALFVGAAVAGAHAAGAPAGPWRLLGERLGEAYQVADDLGDALADEADTGKPVRQDGGNGCPSAVLELGEEAATARLRRLVAEAMEAVPECPGAERLRASIVTEMERVLPKNLALVAA